MSWYICPDCGRMDEADPSHEPITCPECGTVMVLEDEPDEEEE